MKYLKLKYFLLCGIFLLWSEAFVSQCVYSQTPGKTTIKGTVTDANTGDPLPYVAVLLKGTAVGTLTDSQGKYSIETTVSAPLIEFSFIGYQKESRTIKTGAEQIINISLKLSSITLNEVTVKPTKKEYRNKNNPAVVLLQKVIEHKVLNRNEAYSYLEYEKYEKIQLAVSNIDEAFTHAKIFRKYSFIFNNIDTTKRIGRDVLPVFIKESVSDHYYRREPEATKEIIRAEKTINLEEYLDNKGVSANLNYLYQNINIYDNEILFMTNSAPAFYRYYILDTLLVKDIKCIKLFFEPRNPADFLFHGDLYITMDSSYAVREIDMGINKNINIDWIKDISVKQDFEQFAENQWLLSKEEISIDIGITKNTPGLYGQRTISYSGYKLNEPIDDKVFLGPETSEKIDPSSASPGYWEANRQLPLSKTERAIYAMVDSVKKVPAFRHQMGIIMLLTTEFYTFHNVEIGPVGNFYSFNGVEGSRFRFGGRTTTDFSKKVTFDGYLAYGLGDKAFKYNAGITYSLTPRTIYQFPVKSIRLSYQKDTRIPGQELQFAQGDNIFLSFKRGPDDKILLNNTLRFEYLNEFENHFSWLLGFAYNLQQPKGSLHFNYDGYLSLSNNVGSINISEIYLNLRYAPNESFYQGKLYRDPFPNQYPVIQLKLAGGSKLISSDFDYLRLQMNISRRFYVSILGYTDVAIEGGRIFGKVSYPLLFIHRANQTYSYQKNSYNLMNFLEFVGDKYISLTVDHSFNGFILNKIPLVKKLKFREIITFKVLYGGLDKNNNPDYQADLFKFPVSINEVPLTYTLGKKPYIEASVGLSNILRIFRVDLIKRFTYLDHPDVSGLGFRIQFRLDI
jgi:hypothetical protein